MRNIVAVIVILFSSGLLSFSGTPESNSSKNNNNQFPLNYSQERKVEIPVDLKNENKSIREVILFVSSDEREHWINASRGDGNVQSLFYEAPQDGLYYFSMMVIKNNGERSPADENGLDTGIRILVDTIQPKLAIRNDHIEGNSLVFDFAIEEKNPDFSSFRLEYRDAKGKWSPIRYEAKVHNSRVAIREFRKLNLTAIRIHFKDLVGNETTTIKEIKTDTIVKDQANNSELTKVNNSEPAVPGGDMLPAFPTALPLNPMNGTTNGTPTRSWTPMGNNPNITNNANTSKNSANSGGESSPLRELNPNPSLSQNLPPDMQIVAQTGVPKESQSDEPGIRISGYNDSLNQDQKENIDNEKKLAPLQLISVTKFNLGFEVKSVGPSGVRQAQLWVTRDDGKNWKLWKTYDRPESAIEVDLAAKGSTNVEGVYGFKIVLVNGAGISGGAPKANELPEMRVEVDVTSPEIKLYNPILDPKAKDTLILRWQAFDRHMSSEPITLEWSERKDGPWISILENSESVESSTEVSRTVQNGSKRLHNLGSYHWKLPKKIPAQVYLRITAIDRPGNEAVAVTPKPVLVDLAKPEASIHGILGTSTSLKR